MLRIILCQMRVVADKYANLKQAAKLTRGAVCPEMTEPSTAKDCSRPPSNCLRFTRDHFTSVEHAPRKSSTTTDDSSASSPSCSMERDEGKSPPPGAPAPPATVPGDTAKQLEAAPISHPNHIAASSAIAATSSGSPSTVVVVLPESFNCPYDTTLFTKYAEPLPSVGTTVDGINQETMPTCSAMAALARELRVWIVAGSMPEYCDEQSNTGAQESSSTTRPRGRYHNTTFVVDPNGTVCAIYRKIHLFKIDTAPFAMHEGAVITAGNVPTVFTVPTGSCGEVATIGLGICFDVRYPQLVLHYRDVMDTQVIVFPATFNMVTGPAQWELAARSRAVDAQQFVVMCSSARDVEGCYVAFGQSIIVDPAGRVVARAGNNPGDCGDECIVTADVNLSEVAAIRGRLPIMARTRGDLYELRFRPFDTNVEQ